MKLEAQFVSIDRDSTSPNN